MREEGAEFRLRQGPSGVWESIPVTCLAHRAGTPDTRVWTFDASVAGRGAIRVEALYDAVYRLCAGYLTDAAPAVTVRTVPEDLAREREKAAREAVLEGLPPVDWDDGYLETLAVYRKIATALLEYDCLLMHGAAVAVGTSAWLFTAPSGTGKTTHIRFWLDRVPGAFAVNGDKPLLRVGERVEVCGTPWAGKEGLNRNVTVPLRGIVLLERAEENAIAPASFSEALPRLLQQTYRPPEAAALRRTLELLRSLGGRVRLWRLGCTPEPEAADTAWAALGNGRPDCAQNLLW